jgi:hypothetical protein
MVISLANKSISMHNISQRVLKYRCTDFLTIVLMDSKRVKPSPGSGG